MKVKKYDLILGFLILVNLFLCLYLVLSHQSNYLCLPGSSCSYVQDSIYSTLFGIKLSLFGVACFALLFIAFLIARFKRKLYWIFFVPSIVGAGLSLYFMYLQLFVLGKVCTDCFLIDGIMIFMFIIVIFELIEFRKEIKSSEKFVEAKLYK